ncbi:MAG TPA: hypothetical protein VJ982_13565 [Gemmatimonadota bacterium]|nr:hypothetical protein [Gemmatimonadota bacterium]
MNTLSTARVAAVALGLTTLSATSAPAQLPETIIVRNALDRSVLVWVDGVPREVVGADQEETVGDAPEGVVTLMATDASSGAVIATEHTSLTEGETFTWTLYLVPVAGEAQGTGTVVLANGLDMTIEVRFGGETRAVLAPGATRVLPRVVAGTVEAVATAPDGTSLAAETLTILPGEITRWEIGA